MRRALDWANDEPQLDIHYSPTRGRIETGAGLLLRLATTGWPEKIQVQLQTLANRGEPWDDERVEQLVRELADIGMRLAQSPSGAAAPPLLPKAPSLAPARPPACG